MTDGVVLILLTGLPVVHLHWYHQQQPSYPQPSMTSTVDAICPAIIYTRNTEK